jgi:hypothetical protein
MQSVALIISARPILYSCGVDHNISLPMCISVTYLKITLVNTTRINLLFYLYFPPSFHLTAFVSVLQAFIVNKTFSTGLVGVENVVLTTKGLQDRNKTC